MNGEKIRHKKQTAVLVNDHFVDQRHVQQPFVSIIIPVFNDTNRLKFCLEALSKQTYPKTRYEIIVIDNGSMANPKDVVDRFDCTRLDYENRRGSYAARNKGVSLTKGEVIAFTDSDCIPQLDWIEKGVIRLQSSPGIGIVGGNVVFKFKNKKNPNSFELYDRISYFQQRSNIELHHFSITANLFTLREVFYNVGLFNDKLKSGGDIEWGKRVQNYGYSSIYAHDTIVFHPARNSLFQLTRKTMRVTEGLQELKKINNEVYLRDTIYDFLPPIQRVSRILSDKRVKGFRKKIEVIIIILILKYVKVWSKVRWHIKYIQQENY